jgi:hypothetical protein
MLINECQMIIDRFTHWLITQPIPSDPCGAHPAGPSSGAGRTGSLRRWKNEGQRLVFDGQSMELFHIFLYNNIYISMYKYMCNCNLYIYIHMKQKPCCTCGTSTATLCFLESVCTFFLMVIVCNSAYLKGQKRTVFV